MKQDALHAANTYKKPKVDTINSAAMTWSEHCELLCRLGRTR